MSFLETSVKGRKWIFWAKQTAVIQNASPLGGKTEPAFACLLPKTNASECPRRLGSQNAGNILKPGCLTLGFWKAV